MKTLYGRPSVAAPSPASQELFSEETDYENSRIRISGVAGLAPNFNRHKNE